MWHGLLWVYCARITSNEGVTMKHVLWLLVTLPVLFVLTVYVGSEIKLRSYVMPGDFDYELQNDPATLARGQHAMRIRGCLSCHGEQLQGNVFEDKWPWVKRAVAPNLAAYARTHELAVIERAIRHGIGADGKALWAMPSFSFIRLSDADVAAMVAYMRSMPVVNKTLDSPSLGWAARWYLFSNQAQHSAAMATQVPALQLDSSRQPVLAKGEYVAMTTCNECHGRDLRGEVFFDEQNPDLTLMIKAYSEVDFRRLMKHGEALGGRSDLGLMTYVAQSRFAYFTEQELTGLYAYLNSLSADESN